MATEWRTGLLGDCISLRSGGTPSKSRSDFWSGAVPWASAKDMKSYWIEDTQDHLTELGANEASCIVEAGTTLLLVRGMTLHNDVPICRVRRPSAFNQDVKAVLPRSGTHQEFVSYLLLGNKPTLLSIVDSAGHGTGRLNTDTLLQLPVHIPPLTEQQAIAGILGTLDDKIDLNRRMNETLEAMAQAVFKSWFVDFDPVRAKMDGRQPAGMDAATAALFPARFQDSPLGPVPQGWTAKPLPDAIEVNPRRALKAGIIAPYLDMKNLPTQGHCAEEVIYREFTSGTKFQNGDTLVARITPCLENGKTGFVDFLENGQVGWGSTEYIVFAPKSPLPPQFGYLLARSDALRSHAIQNMTGTSGRQRVPSECFNTLFLAVPTSEVARRFDELTAPLMAKIKANSQESRTLATVLDAILPRMLLGKIECMHRCKEEWI